MINKYVFIINIHFQKIIHKFLRKRQDLLKMHIFIKYFNYLF